MNNDRLAKQQERINMVIQWLKDEGYQPEEKTHLYPDTNYFAIVKIDERSAFHIIFPSKNLDSVIVLELIALNEEYRKSYAALQAIEQRRFFFDLKLALLQTNVVFGFEKDVKQLESLEIKKPIYFDGLTKERFFETIFTVHRAIEIAKAKLGQFRDSILPSKAGDSDNSLL